MNSDGTPSWVSSPYIRVSLMKNKLEMEPLMSIHGCDVSFSAMKCKSRTIDRNLYTWTFVQLSEQPIKQIPVRSVRPSCSRQTSEWWCLIPVSGTGFGSRWTGLRVSGTADLTGILSQNTLSRVWTKWCEKNKTKQKSIQCGQDL